MLKKFVLDLDKLRHFEIMATQRRQVSNMHGLFDPPAKFKGEIERLIKYLS